MVGAAVGVHPQGRALGCSVLVLAWSKQVAFGLLLSSLSCGGYEIRRLKDNGEISDAPQQ